MGAAKLSKKQRGKEKAKLKAGDAAKTHVKFNEDGDKLAKNGAPAVAKKKRTRTAPAETKEVGGKSDRSPEMIQSAKYYLEQWQTRNEPKAADEMPWKFKKMKQQWILQWMYEADVVPKSTFAITLEYIAGIQGVARKRVLDSAHEVIDKGVPEKGEDDAEEQDLETKLARRRYKRALQVAEALA